MDKDMNGNPIGVPYVGTDGVKRDRHGNPIPFTSNVNDTDVITPLASEDGASMIGTEGGDTVEEELQNLKDEIEGLSSVPTSTVSYSVNTTGTISDSGKVIKVASIEYTLPALSANDVFVSWIQCTQGPALIYPNSGKTINGKPSIQFVTYECAIIAWISSNWYVVTGI